VTFEAVWNLQKLGPFKATKVPIFVIRNGLAFHCFPKRNRQNGYLKNRPQTRGKSINTFNDGGSTAGLPDFSWFKHTKMEKIYTK
jgi:hypothetical protein